MAINKTGIVGAAGLILVAVITMLAIYIPDAGALSNNQELSVNGTASAPILAILSFISLIIFAVIILRRQVART